MIFIHRSMITISSAPTRSRSHSTNEFVGDNRLLFHKNNYLLRYHKTTVTVVPSKRLSRISSGLYQIWILLLQAWWSSSHGSRRTLRALNLTYFATAVVFSALQNSTILFFPPMATIHQLPTISSFQKIPKLNLVTKIFFHRDARLPDRRGLWLYISSFAGQSLVTARSPKMLAQSCSIPCLPRYVVVTFLSEFPSDLHVDRVVQAILDKVKKIGHFYSCHSRRNSISFLLFPKPSEWGLECCDSRGYRSGAPGSVSRFFC